MPAATIIPFELPLPQILPTIEGNVDYRDFRDQLLRINSLLVQSDLETQMIEADLQRWLPRQKRLSAKAQQNHQLHARRALRCNIPRILLHEATRTLRGSVRLIRDQGLKHRMEEPETFISRINGLCIKMTHVWNRKDQLESRRRRKQPLRQMDRLVGTVRNHARRYRQLLDKHWEQTDWTRPQAEQVLQRMDQVLEQLPKARQQARQRILQGQLVANE